MENAIRTSIHGVEVGDGTKVKVMGVLNLSKESFYSDSVVGRGSIVEVARQMVERGASFLDMGARSTWPLAPEISIEEEESRTRDNLGAILEKIDEVGKETVISVDTQYASVLKIALDLGDQYGYKKFVLNDVSGLVTDEEQMRILLETRPVPVVIMPAFEKPGDIYLPRDVVVNLREKIVKLREWGVKSVVVDPGIGKWVEFKKPVDDLILVNEIPNFRALECPILVAISRKSFIGSICSAPDPKDRFIGTLAATALAVYNGAHIVRTHDVNKETQDAIRVAEVARAELK
ncbi:MAG: dihydropteroate synthase [Promethearchaeota archaeon]